MKQAEGVECLEGTDTKDSNMKVVRLTFWGVLKFTILCMFTWFDVDYCNED